MKEITYSRGALKTMARMPASTARLIRSEIDRCAVDSAELANNVKALQGINAFRLPVGDWRVLFSEVGEVIVIIKIAPCGSFCE